jgi:hypothetical protein
MADPAGEIVARRLRWPSRARRLAGAGVSL